MAFFGFKWLGTAGRHHAFNRQLAVCKTANNSPANSSFYNPTINPMKLELRFILNYSCCLHSFHTIPLFTHTWTLTCTHILCVYTLQKYSHVITVHIGISILKLNWFSTLTLFKTGMEFSLLKCPVRIMPNHGFTFLYKFRLYLHVILVPPPPVSMERWRADFNWHMNFFSVHFCLLTARSYPGSKHGMVLALVQPLLHALGSWGAGSNILTYLLSWTVVLNGPAWISASKSKWVNGGGGCQEHRYRQSCCHWYPPPRLYSTCPQTSLILPQNSLRKKMYKIRSLDLILLRTGLERNYSTIPLMWISQIQLSCWSRCGFGPLILSLFVICLFLYCPLTRIAPAFNVLVW